MRPGAALLVFSVLALALPAWAEEPAKAEVPEAGAAPGEFVKFADVIEIHAADGSTLKFPYGATVISTDAFARLDVEVKRLQEVETRLKAENVSLRESLEHAISPKTIGLAVLFGLVAYGVIRFTWYGSAAEDSHNREGPARVPG